MHKAPAIGLFCWLAGCAHAPQAAAPATSTSMTIPWKQHDEQRPQPRIARPTSALLMRAPADATVLFDGVSLQAWRDGKDGPARWRVENGYMEVVPGSGDIHTASAWGDVQLHVEFATPVPPEGEGQHRGNSGVFLMTKYEVQVLDSYGNTTYPDGQAAAIFGQYPPLVNASLPPGEWQSYDIVFHAPRFAGARVAQAARCTVFHNGVLVQDNVELVGPTSFGQRDPYVAHPDRLPLSLQDHGQPVRYRNIWIRELLPGE
ncbi:MAG TPA: DUF1080 domain-containing protein [Longimicrobiales bacterium]